MKVPFKTPVDYFTEVLLCDYNNINRSPELIARSGWSGIYDSDLHIYPYNDAIPGMLSVGCPNKCPFCPSAVIHEGKIVHADPELVIPQLANKTVHFMDENFFYNDMKEVLPLLAMYNVTWLAMSDYQSTLRVLEEFGEHNLYECGCRVVEMGLENVALYQKVKKPIETDLIQMYYLNMTCFPGETKETIRENAKWMAGTVSLLKPIHHNNGVWYACGQFLYPYTEPVGGAWVLERRDFGVARTRPTWLPDSLLDETYEVVSLSMANYYSQLVYGKKIYRPKMQGTIREFVKEAKTLRLTSAQDEVAWLLTGIRNGAIV